MTARQARLGSAMLLKGFCEKPQQECEALRRVDKVSHTKFMASPRNVASARDFNRGDAEGVAPDHVESGYAKFESLLAPALRRTGDSRNFGNAEDHNLVLNLIALLVVRTPRMRENVRDFHERVARQVMSLTVANKERYESIFGRAVEDGYIDGDTLVSYDAMKDFVDRGQYTIEVGTTHHAITS
jgi:hypothetical protein